MLKISNLVAIFTLSVASLTMPLKAQELPESALTSYTNFRAALLKYGWLPDRSYGAKMNDGTWMYRYPEVICGNSMCSAQWIARNGRKLNIAIWMDDTGEYRVAPQIDWIER